MNLFIGTKNFSYHVCYEHIAKYSRVKGQTARQTDHGETELNNMLVKKSVLNEINKVGILTQGFKE